MEQDERIRGAEIVLWSDAGGRSLTDLSPLQLTVALRALGYEENFQTGEYTMFADDTLRNILNGKINPFRITRVKDDE